jgi:probable phosphoglycerate mutase
MSGFPIHSSCLEGIPVPLRQAVLGIVETAAPCSSPLLIHLLGPPGFGKSTVAALLAEMLGALHPVVVAFDRLMESVPEYRDSPDREQAFREWELPARDAGYTLIGLLIDRQVTIILDHSGAVPAHVELLAYARQSRSYHVAVVRVQTPLDIAARRIAARHAAGGRFVPPQYLADRYAAIKLLLNGYIAAAHYYVEISNELDGDAGFQHLRADCSHIAEHLMNMAEPGTAAGQS